MDQGLALTISGTIATLVFGGVGIYLAIRRRYPGRILFIREDCIGLFDSIVRNLPELSVQFNDAPVKENLVLLKGCFLNTGHKDISITMVEQPLQAILPEGYRWLTAKVVAAPPAVKASVRVASSTALEFDLGLFRCEEFLKFEALAEVPTLDRGGLAPAASLERDLTLDHRIADTGRIETVEAPLEAITPSQFYVKVAMLSVVLLALVFTVVSASRDQSNFRTNLGEMLKGHKPAAEVATSEESRERSASLFFIITASVVSAYLFLIWFTARDLWLFSKFKKLRGVSSGNLGPRHE